MTFWDHVAAAIARDFADIDDVERMTTVCFRLLLAGVLGGLLGYERESKGKAAGLRTHMLVAVGAALFVMGPRLANFSDAGVSRVIQGLVAGIGFLGAGAIVKGKPGEEVQGLTTAAAVWMTAAIGVTVGMGRASTAIISTVIALVVLTLLCRGVGWLHRDAAAAPKDDKCASGDSRDTRSAGTE